MSALAIPQGLARLPGWTVLLLWTAAVLLPLYILVVSCFKTTAEIYDNRLGMPQSWALDNFVRAWTRADL
ncbi:carbohydrate ABC transporter permease, partial [Mesorhizobium sp. VK2D]|nr:carbohydrate ABC transporter permease [Mesorhizobium sp. VK2D]